ncbi:group 1 truncated hemoglobin [Rhodoferax sp. TBRC 17660]|uniref:Group 1 truncated hemoglobin n=1 Tax=Rhodoferax potami TaxID=3068338 RepID=A0ABU3KRC9_9BURK|nr:group 1 truncated hemoglobin [Rhodoferax sp. TBRC 17660]MDT7519898.1 group 1 truncated hemoglobin [Rhodoferax sp. TBRC 17660]
MKTLVISIALVAASFNASAQTVAPVKNDALYQALGGTAGLKSLMDVFVAGLKADARIGDQFKDTKSSYLSEQLTNQVCVLSGGPCTYDGETMKNAHAGLKINKGHFNALVEVLQVSMDARNIPFSTQNQLLALLAPMHRDVITVK